MSLPTRTYPNFGAALLRCGDGYEEVELARTVVAKTARFGVHPSESLPTVGVLLAAATIGGLHSGATVVDLGGAAGAHYLDVRRLIPRELTLDWTVVETKTMVQEARTLAFGHEVRFTERLDEALSAGDGSADLLLASGALMYLPDPMETLRQIVAAGPRRIIFSRTGLSPDMRNRIVVQRSRLSQNGPGPLPEGRVDRIVSYPCTILPRDEFEQVLWKRYANRLFAVENPRAWRAGRGWIPQYSIVADLR